MLRTEHPGLKAALSSFLFEGTTRKLAFLLGAIGLVATVILFAGPGGWSDLAVYTGAAAIRAHGGDAYGTPAAGGLIFIYAPLVLRFFALFGGWLGWVLVVWYAATLMLLLKAEMRPVAIGIVIAAAGMIFVRNRFCQAVHTGNVAVFLHLTLIFLWMRYGRHGRVALFYAAIFAASLVKPFYLAYALVPLLCGTPLRLALLRGGSVTLATAAAWLAQMWLWPRQYHELARALVRQIGNNDAHAYSGDIGLGFFRLAAFLYDDATVAMAAWALAAAALAAVWYVINRRNIGRTDSGILASLSALAVAILVNPRLKVYDDGIMTALWFGYLYVAANRLSDRRAKWAFWTYVAMGSVLSLVKTSTQTVAAGFWADGFLVYFPPFAVTAWAWSDCGQADGKRKRPRRCSATGA